MERETRDIVRQVAVGVGAIAAIVGAAWGSGAFGGTPIEEAADGALAADATLLGAATPAFQIWSVIYAGLAAFAVVQALPSRAADSRYRRTGWWILASMALNALWIAVVQAGWLWLSVVVLVAIVAVLETTASLLISERGGSWIDRAVTDVTVGVYLGWSLVASAANFAAALALQETGAAVALTIIVLAVGVLIMVRIPSRPIGATMMLAAAWGLTWIGVARLDAPHNTTVATTAFVAAVIAAGAAAWRLTRATASGLA